MAGPIKREHYMGNFQFRYLWDKAKGYNPRYIIFPDGARKYIERWNGATSSIEFRDGTKAKFSRQMSLSPQWKFIIFVSEEGEQ